MLLEGEHKCDKCGHNIEWYHQAAQKMSSRIYDVDVLPEDKTGLYRVTENEEQNGYTIPKRASLYCPKCGELNYIEINDLH